MRAIMMVCCAGLFATAAEAGEAEPYFAAFDVAQSPAPHSREIAAFDLAGAPVSVNAYGRKERARAMGASEESDELRKLSGAFDRTARPAVVTIEAQIRF